MNKHIAAALLVVVASAVSAQQWERPDRQPIDVEVINGRIVVKEEVAHTTAAHGGLVWRIVQPGFRFPDNGITIHSDHKHRCGAVGDGRRYRCAKLRHDPGESYKYDVRVVEQRTQKALDPLDPMIMND